MSFKSYHHVLPPRYVETQMPLVIVELLAEASIFVGQICRLGGEQLLLLDIHEIHSGLVL